MPISKLPARDQAEALRGGEVAIDRDLEVGAGIGAQADILEVGQ
jgi:hypothetical protein